MKYLYIWLFKLALERSIDIHIRGGIDGNILTVILVIILGKWILYLYTH